MAFISLPRDIHLEIKDKKETTKGNFTNKGTDLCNDINVPYVYYIIIFRL